MESNGVSTLNDCRPSPRVKQRIGIFSFTVGHTTSVCLLSLFSWFSGILESANQNVSVAIPKQHYTIHFPSQILKWALTIFMIYVLTFAYVG